MGKANIDHRHPRTSSAIVGRAEKFLWENHASRVSIAELSNSLGISVRSLQAAFRQECNCTPTAMLKSIRLHQARLELLRGAPGMTVTEAAIAHGNTHLGRFSVEYSRHFGEAPSRTLKRTLRHRPRELRTSLKHQSRAALSGYGTNAPELRSDEQKRQVCGEALAMIMQGSHALQGLMNALAHFESSLKYRRGAIVLKRNGDGRPLVYAHCDAGRGRSNALKETKLANAALETGRGFINRVMETGTSRLVGNLVGNLDYIPMDASVTSEICYPILSNGEVIGAINFESEREHAFNNVDKELLSDLAIALAPIFKRERKCLRQGLSDVHA